MAPAENGKTILIAEDEQPVRTFAAAVLQRNGYGVITAADGQEALDKSRQFTGPIHLLLSDVQMPKMSGIELATQLQIERPQTRVLLMSNMAPIWPLNKGWQFLPKPLTFTVLKDRVYDILRVCDIDIESVNGRHPITEEQRRDLNESLAAVMRTLDSAAILLRACYGENDASVMRAAEASGAVQRLIWAVERRGAQRQGAGG